MKSRLLRLITLVGLVAALAVVAAACGGGGDNGEAGADGGTSTTAPTAATNAPAVPNASSVRALYGGKSITFIGDSVGGGHTRDLALARRFTQDTGIKVKVVPHPTASDAAYSQLARVFSTKSSSFDVAMIDVVWPGAFAPYLVDLKPKLADEAKLHAQGIIRNNTVDGRLVAMPWFGDYGILYYRTDLLEKYGSGNPPTTWTELFAMAKKIQDGEKKNNSSFSGFVFQGNAYEGLTTVALEWIASSGGGTFLDNGGKVTINNPKAAAILDLVRTNIGRATPRGVTSYQEGEAHTAFLAGNAAFMRNWPYAYSLAADPEQSKIAGKFNVTTLPHGPGGTSVGTVGGWQLAVNKFSKNVDASIEFVRYMTSPAVQKFDAITNTNVPTIPSVATDEDVVDANPYLKPDIANVARVTRPANSLKAHYNEGSKAIYQGINQILNGTPASNVLPSIEAQLERLAQ